MSYPKLKFRIKTRAYPYLTKHFLYLWELSADSFQWVYMGMYDTEAEARLGARKIKDMRCPPAPSVTEFEL